MDLLNDDLRGKITIFLNGQIIHKIDAMRKFDIVFLSELTFKLKKKAYSLEENLVVEQDYGDEIFFITQGRVAMLHSQTRTYITDVTVSFVIQ